MQTADKLSKAVSTWQRNDSLPDSKWRFPPDSNKEYLKFIIAYKNMQENGEFIWQQ